MPNRARTGSAERPLRVAVVGSGPAGFFTADALLRQTTLVAEVDVFERLPTPYGLVRTGVAPDHARVKTVVAAYEKTAARAAFRFFGNVTLGLDIEIAHLRPYYDQIVYAVGNEADRRLGVEGEGLWGCIPGAVFVGWYNGHPDYRPAPIRLDAERVAIIGHGNVAVDVARILARTPDELATTDIADHALEVLRGSQVREIYVLGRRGPMEAAFTPAELKELTQLPHATVVVDPAELALDEAGRAALASAEARTQKNLSMLAELARPSEPRARTIHLRFCRSPLEILGDDFDRVRGLRLEKNRLERRPDGSVKAVGTGEIEEIAVGMVVPAVGFEGKPLRGVPFDAARRTVSNRDGRVVDAQGAVVPGEYAVGWAATGAKGLIGTHRGAATELVGRMVEDAQQAAPRRLSPHDAVGELLKTHDVPYVSFDDWKRLDAIEVARGARRGAPRSKLTDVDDMLETLRR